MLRRLVDIVASALLSTLFAGVITLVMFITASYGVTVEEIEDGI